MRVGNTVLDLVGATPIVRLQRLPEAGSAEVYVKLEFFNPASSVKDRIAKAMIEDAEARGLLKPGMTIVEPTSGNTGIGLAMVAAVKGYQALLVMPETMSVERRNLLRAFGAQLELTPGSEGMKGAIARANQLIQEHPQQYFMPQQFENGANPKIHRETTGREILFQMGSFLHAFVVGIGTGGTITGAGGLLKEQIPGIQVVAVEPANSPVLSEGHGGSHKIQGLGPGFVPGVLNREVYDEVITVTDEDAIQTGRRLTKEEGILGGISSGANVWAALQVAKRLGAGKRVLTVAPDTGERYLSTALFQFE